MSAANEPITVKRIEFRGQRVVKAAELQAVARTSLDRPLLPADIEDLQTRLTQVYVDRGYSTSAVVLDPDAPVEYGVLRFLVIEGHLKDVRVKGQKGLRASYVADRLRGSPDEVLNVNELRERYQRLLDDPLFEHINPRLEPGDEPGEAILDVDIDRARPYSLVMALNNYRPPSIYEKAYDLSGEVRDLSGFGDVVDIDLTGPLNFLGGVGYNLSWQLPFNRFGSALTVSIQRAETVVSEAPLSVLDIRSTIERQELRLTQPLWTTLTQQFSISGSVAHEENLTELAGTPLSSLPGATDGAIKAISERLIPEYSFRTSQQYWGVRLTLLHAYLLDYPSPPVASDFPSQQYCLWTLQVRNLREFSSVHLELETRATLQRSGARISDLHTLAIGGINSVRGFRESDLLATDVNNINVDLRWLATPMRDWIHPGLTVGPFFDWADGHDVGQATSTFSSLGVSTRGKWPHAQVDIAYGVPMIRPGFTRQEHGSWQDHGIHAQVAFAL